MKEHELTLNQPLMKELMAVTKAPCLSLYMPIHHYPIGNIQDSVMYRHLVTQLELSLLRHYSAIQTHFLLAPFEGLKKDTAFWDSQKQGLAIFSCVGLKRIIKLQGSVVEDVVVGDSFDLTLLRQQPIRPFPEMA